MQTDFWRFSYSPRIFWFRNILSQNQIPSYEKTWIRPCTKQLSVIFAVRLFEYLPSFSRSTESCQARTFRWPSSPDFIASSVFYPLTSLIFFYFSVDILFDHELISVFLERETHIRRVYLQFE